MGCNLYRLRAKESTPKSAVEGELPLGSHSTSKGISGVQCSGGWDINWTVSVPFTYYWQSSVVWVGKIELGLSLTPWLE
jgi:hypothetical protein